MIIYRDADSAVSPRPLLRRLARDLRMPTDGAADRHDRIVEGLIRFGELEAGLADALFPERDGLDPLAGDCRRAALGFGALLWWSWRGRERGLPAPAPAPAPDVAALATAVDRLAEAPLPDSVRLRTPEGYAWYGLYPETYIDAAETAAEALGAGPAVCLGLRSIGTGLSAVVGATLAAHGCAVASHTLRPRGPPFERRPVLTAALAAALRAHADAGAHFLIVDEGPGLSGSSLCGTAAVLAELGIPDHRIVLLPAWVPEGTPADMPFATAAVRRRWSRHRKFVGSFEPIRRRLGRFGTDARDLSGGAWRSLIGRPESAWPAVQPQHERLKFLAGDRLFKFAGLGRYGTEKAVRAQSLADAGFAPPVHGCQSGFLETGFVAGRQGAIGDMDTALADTVVRYLAFRRHAFPAEQTVPVDGLFAMIETNVRAGLGATGLARLSRLDRLRPVVTDAPVVAIDGRMLPHEWLRTARGFIKTDGVDHHDDHFLPGCQDIAWDIAGTGAEFGLPPSAENELAERLAVLIADPELPLRLVFHRVAYLSFRLGYVLLAAATLRSSPDGARMDALARRYRRRLRRALSAL